jgi:hypothetical protein
LNVITDLPEGRGTRRAVYVIVLVEPIAQNTSSRANAADLYAFGAPAFFAVEDGEGRPADGAGGGLADRAFDWRVSGVSWRLFGVGVIDGKEGYVRWY